VGVKGDQEDIAAVDTAINPSRAENVVLNLVLRLCRA
jgi:hypothetical protein